MRADEVYPLHNIAHLLIGAALLIAGLTRAAAAKAVNITVGAVYLLLGIVGFFLVGTGANILALNTPCERDRAPRCRSLRRAGCARRVGDRLTDGAAALPMSRMMRSAPVVAATRAFLAVAALGAGLLHAALAPGVPLPLLLMLVGIAVAELAWRWPRSPGTGLRCSVSPPRWRSCRSGCGPPSRSSARPSRPAPCSSCRSSRWVRPRSSTCASPARQPSSFYVFDDIAKPKVFKAVDRAQLDAVDWTDEERDRVIAEVALAFRFNTELFEDLAASKAAAA